MERLVAWQFDRKSCTEKIKAKMREAALTCPQLAAEIGLSYDTLNNLLNCKSEMTVERLCKICIVLDMDLQKDFLAPAMEGIGTDFDGRLYNVIGRQRCETYCNTEVPQPKECGNRAGCEKQLRIAIDALSAVHEDQMSRAEAVSERNLERTVKNLQEGNDRLVRVMQERIDAQITQVHNLRRQKGWAFGIAITSALLFGVVALIHVINHGIHP